MSYACLIKEEEEEEDDEQGKNHVISNFFW